MTSRDQVPKGCELTQLEDLPELLSDVKKNANKVNDLLDQELVKVAIERVNTVFATRRLSKSTGSKEPLPTDPRQLSSYRTRMGTMMEYAISTEIDALLMQTFGNKLALTFAVAHEYPDFYLRNEHMDPVLRIEMKSVDAASDEQAARFETPTSQIRADGDFLLFIGWEWKQEHDREYPNIFSYVVVPSIELALERDKRLSIVGGRVEGNRILVPSTKKKGDFVDDPGNYGKLWRIVHSSRRRNDKNLSLHVKRFIEFLRDVDKRSPHRRLAEQEQEEMEINSYG